MLPDHERVATDTLPASHSPCPVTGPRAGHEPPGPKGGSSRMMRAYELMVIIDGDVEDPKAQSWVKTVTDGIEAAGGTIHGRPDWWGKRQFAYPINRKEPGYYLVVEPIAPAGSRLRPGGGQYPAGGIAGRAGANTASGGRSRPPQADPTARRRGRAPRHH